MRRKAKIANSARPAPPAGSRAATRTGRWKPKFLAALAVTGNVTESAARASVDRKTTQTHAKNDKAFAAACVEALEIYADKLEAEADRRAYNGVEDVVLCEGVPVFVWVNAKGVIFEKGGPGRKRVALVKRRYSDDLLKTRLRAVRPDKYRERVQHSHDGSIGFGGGAEGEAEADKLLAELRGRLGIDGGAAPSSPGPT